MGVAQAGFQDTFQVMPISFGSFMQLLQDFTNTLTGCQQLELALRQRILVSTYGQVCELVFEISLQVTDAVL